MSRPSGDQTGSVSGAGSCVSRSGRSYTLDTLSELKEELPGQTLCLFVGDDAFNEFLTWHRPLDILELAHLVVMQRPTAQPPQDAALRQLLSARLAGGFPVCRPKRLCWMRRPITGNHAAS